MTDTKLTDAQRADWACGMAEMEPGALAHFTLTEVPAVICPDCEQESDESDQLSDLVAWVTTHKCPELPWGASRA
jgi:hypothetical protein